MVWMLFIEGSNFLCRKPFLPSGIIPNFCLSSQPSGIPQTFAWIAFRFSTYRGPLYLLCSLFFSLSFLSHFSTQNSCFLFFLFPFFFPFKYGSMRGFDCSNLPLSHLVNTNQSIIMTPSLQTKRWTMLSSLSS